MPTRQRSADDPRDRTSELLLEIRQGYRHPDGRTGLRQVDAAALSGLTQSKITRAERGQFTLHSDEAAQYGHALNATPDQRRELVELCSAVKADTVSGQTRIIRRAAEIQRRIRLLETQSRVIRSWQPTIVPGLLQTWEYTVALDEWTPDEAWAVERRGRLALLDDPDKRFEQVLSEAALRWIVGSQKVMNGQLRHLVELSERPNIDVAILPFGQTMVPPPEGTFHLYDSRAAQVATDIGPAFPTERPDLDAFAATFRRLSEAAAHEAEARTLIERVARGR